MKTFLITFVVGFLLFSCASPARALEDPRTIPNNKIGIHILFPQELSQAAKLVNSNGGDWGYVTIPIQVGDKNLKKWQDFFNQCKSLHLIPIVRLSTEGDYFNSSSWRIPNYTDILDFANFLNSLTWPVENRYIVVFNEVNRADEWGGIQPDPGDYANKLSYAVTAFKSLSPDFFIISAGMDNAAANTNTSMDEYTFFQQMQSAVPGIFNQIDGVSSHSYPNPAFSTPPWIQTRESDDSFPYEHTLIESFTSKDLPIFITETGWSQDENSQQVIASYVTQAFSTVWSGTDIVAVTPFLLDAGSGSFTSFSFLSKTGNPNAIYNALLQMPKTKGTPTQTPSVLAASTRIESLPVRNFGASSKSSAVHIPLSAKNLVKWFLGYPYVVQ